jgi:hypothetical protein
MYDENGEPAPFGYGGQFHQFILNPYFEYGLTARNTLVVNGSAPWLQFQNNYGKQSSAGLGDIEVAFKRRLNSTESHWAVSSQLTVMFPAYPADRNPAPGNHQVDVEGRFLLGRGLTLGHRHGFYDIEAAYRYRNGAPADQVRADASAGLEVVRRVTLMGQFFAIKSMRNGDPATPNSNPNAQSDFDLYKYQPSIVFAVGHGTKIQGGFCGAFSGRNTGAGHTAILALWKSF